MYTCIHIHVYIYIYIYKCYKGQRSRTSTHIYSTRQRGAGKEAFKLHEFHLTRGLPRPRAGPKESFSSCTCGGFQDEALQDNGFRLSLSRSPCKQSLRFCTSSDQSRMGLCFKAFWNLSRSRRYMSAQLSSGSLVYPTMRRSIFLWVTARWFLSTTVRGTTLRPCSADGITTASNNLSRSRTSTCLSIRTRRNKENFPPAQRTL